MITWLKGLTWEKSIASKRSPSWLTVRKAQRYIEKIKDTWFNVKRQISTQKKSASYWRFTTQRPNYLKVRIKWIKNLVKLKIEYFLMVAILEFLKTKSIEIVSTNTDLKNTVLSPIIPMNFIPNEFHFRWCDFWKKFIFTTEFTDT